MAEKALPQLKPPAGAVKKRKRRGRGPGSGLGKTSGRGHKGQGSRAGGGVRPGFEGGQMPLARRLPKRGFHNPFRREFATINIRDLQRFEAGSTVDEASLRDNNLLPKNIKAGIKILGDGELNIKLTVRAHRFSKSAREKIEAAGGTVEVIEGAQ